MYVNYALLPTTSTSMSLASTTLPTYGPGSTWPTASSGYGSPSIFDGTGGPALIIVFVALGLLVGAFAALLVVVLRSDEVRGMLAALIRHALALPG